MSNIKLSLGYYTERPYGDWALTAKGSDFRKKKIDFDRKLFGTLDNEGVPRTLFILGDFLEKCLDDFTANDLREVYSAANKLNDIQTHGYAHVIFKDIPTQPHKLPVSVEEYNDSIVRGLVTNKLILGVVPKGLGTPYGYHIDLSGMPEILSELSKHGFTYVSSNLQGKDSVETKLTRERQPHTYENAGYPNIVEIPSDGLQDIIFTMEKVKKYNLKRAHTPEEIIKHYTGLFEIAKTIDTGDKPTYISLCLHPWAIMEYDPKLEIHKRIIDSARKEDIEIVSYKQIAEEVLNKN